MTNEYGFEIPLVSEEECRLQERIEELEETINKLREQFALRYDLGDKLKKENAELDMKRKAERQIFQGIVQKKNEQLTKAKEIILKLYNAGRDVLMCRAEEKAFDNLEKAINDRIIEQFLKEIEK